MRRAKERVLRALAFEAGRLAGSIATDDDEREPIGWLEDIFWLGAAKAVEERGVSKRVAADMLGVSRRTYLRRTESAEHQLLQPRLSTWISVRDRLRKKPCPREELEGKYPTLHPRVLGALLHDMQETGWIRIDDDGVLHPRENDSELSDQWLDTFVAYESWVDDQLSAAEVATSLGVDVARVEQALVRLEAGTADIRMESRDGARWDILHMLIVHALDVGRRIANNEPPGDTRAQVFFYHGERVQELKGRLAKLREQSMAIMEDFDEGPLKAKHRGKEMVGWALLHTVSRFDAMFGDLLADPDTD